jgi:acyl-CoA synthetase (AMP-forming)/AMP-acid ligase II
MRTNGTPDPNSGLPRTSASPEAVAALKTALEQCPPLGEAPAPNPWHELFYERLRDQPLPALITGGAITPGASLWTGSRLWLESFRATDLQAGDRLVIALPPSTAFVQVLVAALWEGYTVALTSSDADVPSVVDRLDARAAVTVEPTRHAWVSEEYAGPSATPDALRPPTHDRTPHVRFLLQTSGTTAHARWIALSDRNVLSVLHSHLPHFALHDARLLSVLPWTHAFGLVLDLLPALFAGAEIIRDPEGGRDPASIVRLRDKWGATHLSAVPLTVQRLFDHPDGPDLLRQLQGGIVGGAPIPGPLATRLEDTCLRVGYGQTEAAPGVALGPPGRWEAHYLGRPVGCSVEIAEDGELLFEGSNACVGVWEEDGLNRADPNRTVHTGDRAERDGDDLYFRGRKDQAFKLSNGRLVKECTLVSSL